MEKHDPTAITPDPEQRVVARRSYSLPPETVFDAWVNPDSLRQWFGPPGFHAKILTHDLRVGGDWRFLMQGESGTGHHHFGTFLVIEPPQKLVFTWASEEQVEGWRDLEGNPTLVTVECLPSAEGTRVTVTHEKLVSDTARKALTRGWTGGLDSLELFFTEREGTQ